MYTYQLYTFYSCLMRIITAIHIFYGIRTEKLVFKNNDKNIILIKYLFFFTANKSKTNTDYSHLLFTIVYSY